MEFLKKRVKQYQEKKLNEALSKVKLHTDEKKHWQKLEKDNSDFDESHIKERIQFHSNMESIWKKNSEKVKKEIEKLD